MEITEDLLYAEIGRNVVAVRVLRNQLTASVANQRRLEQENSALRAAAEDGSYPPLADPDITETVGGFSD